MANPVRTEILEGTVVKAASNIAGGVISKHWRDKRNLFYYSTYRLAGQIAPTYAAMKLEMIRMFQKDPEQEIIETLKKIDVYVIAALEDGTTETGILIVAV